MRVLAVLAMLLLLEGLLAFSFTPAHIHLTTPMVSRRHGSEATALETEGTLASKTLDAQQDSVGVVVPTEKTKAKELRPELDAWREYEFLRGDDFDLGALQGYFKGKPLVIARRLLTIAQTLRRTQAAWRLARLAL